MQQCAKGQAVGPGRRKVLHINIVLCCVQCLIGYYTCFYKFRFGCGLPGDTYVTACLHVAPMEERVLWVGGPALDGACLGWRGRGGDGGGHGAAESKLCGECHDLVIEFSLGVFSRFLSVVVFFLLSTSWQ